MMEVVVTNVAKDVQSSSQIITINKPTLSFLWAHVRGPEKSGATLPWDTDQA